MWLERIAFIVASLLLTHLATRLILWLGGSTPIPSGVVAISGVLLLLGAGYLWVRWVKWLHALPYQERLPYRLRRAEELSPIIMFCIGSGLAVLGL